MPPRPPLSVKLIYASGQLGWSLASFGVLNLIPYFYMPPETGEAAFPEFIYQGSILGILTVIGLVNAGGRIFDAITDPWIANYSDKSESKIGKRKSLLAIGMLPLAIFSFLVFLPLAPGNIMLNTLWFTAVIFLFYFFFTLYVVPYNALISELGHHPEDRMSISTLISIAWALGFGLGNMIYFMKDQFEPAFNPVQAFQIALGIQTLLALVCMMIPVLFLKENQYSKQTGTSVPLFSAIKKVWSNPDFRIFTFSDLTYWLSITIIQMGVVYYIAVLLGLDETYASLFMLIAFPLSFLFYIPVNAFVRKFGKKPVIMAGFFLFATNFLLALFLGKVPVPPLVQMAVLILLSAMPLAIFGIVPNALIADMANEHESKESESLAGMYFAVRTFMMKIGTSLGFLFFTSLLLAGKSSVNDLGIRLTGLAALLFCLSGLWIFSKYRE